MAGYKSIADAERANKALGHDWFAPQSREYHGAIVETGIIGQFYWVESANKELGNDESPRVYRVVACDPNGAIQYLSGGDTFVDVEAAKAYIDSVTS